VHGEIGDKVKRLMELDLVKELNQWKEVLNEVREKLAHEERLGAVKTNMKPWLLHWDRQLYKALQLQYQWGIETLHTQMPAIQAQLVFRFSSLCLSPISSYSEITNCSYVHHSRRSGPSIIER
jgi:dynein heavy chain 2